MTEDEAKTKWCPPARIDNTASNRPNSGNNCDVTAGWAPCIASACMAWRWNTKQPPDVGFSGLGIPQGINAHGYCGLAGGQP